MDRVQEAFARRLNPAAAAPLVVAFSGGSDSTAALVTTLAWARPRGRRVIAATVDHGLQAASSAWTKRAAGVAAALGAEFRGMVWTGDKPVTGLPAAARRARHRLLAQAARESGASVIVLGHTRDDLAEAQWMRAEGSSVGSPAEWSPVPVWPQGRGLFHFRPLLVCGRDELRAGLAARGLDWIDDPANTDPHFARARARAALAGRPHTQQAGQVVELSDLAAGCLCDPWGGLSLERSILRRSPPEAARRFLQAAVVCAGGGERPPRADRTRALLGRLIGPAPVDATLAGARVQADVQVSIVRDVGEQRRGGLSPIDLHPDAVEVWDGRFELISRAGGRVLGPLSGLSQRLPPEEHRLVKSAPAAARASLPVVERSDGRLTCPVLAADPGLGCRSLVRDRLLGACGVIAREA